MDMSVEFIVRTVLESLLVILLIIGFIREKKLMRYEEAMRYKLSELTRYFREMLAYLYNEHK